MDDIEKQIRLEESRQKGIDSAKIITDGLNSSNSTESNVLIEGFVEGITRVHRTLQQCSAKAIYEVIKSWADNYDDGNYDGRNEATCKWAKQMIDAVGKDQHFPFI